MFRFLIPLIASGSTPLPTSWDSFKWLDDETRLEKFIGEETEVDIPDGVTEIGREAFSGCSSLTFIEIPASVTKIKPMAFRDCMDLTICAPAGSEAERYAKEKEIPFKIRS